MDGLLQLATSTPGTDCYSRTPSQRAAWTLASASQRLPKYSSPSTQISTWGDHHQTQLLTYSSPFTQMTKRSCALAKGTRQRHELVTQPGWPQSAASQSTYIIFCACEHIL